MKKTLINPRPPKEPTAISFPNASRKPPDIDNLVYDYTKDYEQMSKLAIAKQLDEALRLQNKFVRTLPEQKPIYYHPMEPKPDDLLYSVRSPAGDLVPFYQVGNPYPRWRKNGEPVPAYESMMLNAGYEAELRVDNG